MSKQKIRPRTIYLKFSATCSTDFQEKIITQTMMAFVEAARKSFSEFFTCQTIAEVERVPNYSPNETLEKLDRKYLKKK